MFIGDKVIKEKIDTEEKTPGGIKIVLVEFEDGTKEMFSELMYDKIVSEEICDATTLRDKRIFPVIESLLFTLREWGVKLNELTYMSVVLNQSLSFNEKEALKELWIKWIPTLNSIDEIDLIAIDRVLKSKRVKLKDILEK